MNYKRNRRYFQPYDYALILALGGIGAIVAITAAILQGLAINVLAAYVCYGIGGACLLPAGVIWCVSYAMQPSDAQIDAQYQTLADNAAFDALDKVGLADQLKLEIKPVVLSACIFEKIDSPYLLAKGKDGKIRSSNFANFVLMFTLEQIVTYRSSYSIVAQEWEERIEEYYYDDIVKLATTVKVSHIGGAVLHREVLTITTSAGGELELPFENNGTAKEAIMTIRKILRAKKRFQ